MKTIIISPILSHFSIFSTPHQKGGDSHYEISIILSCSLSLSFLGGMFPLGVYNQNLSRQNADDFLCPSCNIVASRHPRP